MITALNRRIIVVFTTVVLLLLAGYVAYQVLLGHPTIVTDQDLLNLLPPPAEVVVLHRDLRQDWRRLRATNWSRKLMARPELRKFAHKNGLDRPELSDAETWILDVIGERVLAACVPDPASAGRYSVFAFAPVGARAKRLELMADLIQRGQKAGFQMVTTDHHGQPVVRVTVEDWPPNLTVKYTKLHGIVVMVFSETANTLEEYLGGQITAPGVESLAGELGAELGLLNWVQIGACRGRVGGPLRWVLETAGADRLRLTTGMPLAGPPLARVEGGVPIATLAGRLPDGALMRVRGRWSEWLTVAAAYVPFFVPERQHAAQSALGRLKENAPWMGDTFAAALLPGQVMSTKLPLPVPQLAAAVECGDARQAQAGIERGVMDLNKQSKLMLALQATTVAKSPAQRVISQSPDLAGQITRWPVFGFVENAVLAASGDDILGGMLARGTTGAPRGEESSMAWEVRPTLQMTRGLIAAYSLSQMFTGQTPPPHVAAGLARLELAMAVLDAVPAATITAQADGAVARLVVEVSHADLPGTGGGGK